MKFLPLVVLLVGCSPTSPTHDSSAKPADPIVESIPSEWSKATLYPDTDDDGFCKVAWELEPMPKPKPWEAGGPYEMKIRGRVEPVTSVEIGQEVYVDWYNNESWYKAVVTDDTSKDAGKCTVRYIGWPDWPHENVDFSQVFPANKGQVAAP